MTTKKATEKIENVLQKESDARKSCFVIMPIADHPDYEPGHFKRVYDHLVAPACRQAGYEPIRADDNASSNMIMHDILLNIVRSEMVICDLSTNNANVFYELGLRQAFNKKTVLITDGREKTPFDLLGFRYQLYTPALRIDTVSAEITRISAALSATENLQPNEVNSIVKLLEIDSANIEIVQPNENQAFMLQMFNSLSAQISNIANNNQSAPASKTFLGRNLRTYTTISDPFRPVGEHTSFRDLENNAPDEIRNYIFHYKDKSIGTFIGYTNNNAHISFSDGSKNVSFNNSTSIKNQIIGTLSFGY